jgi:lambda repressor-like predicted transcriptional regulator
MANKEKNMHQIQEIFRRKVQGESERSIERNTGFSRSTVREYLKIISICGYGYIANFYLPICWLKKVVSVLFLMG